MAYPTSPINGQVYGKKIWQDNRWRDRKQLLLPQPDVDINFEGIADWPDNISGFFYSQSGAITNSGYPMNNININSYRGSRLYFGCRVSRSPDATDHLALIFWDDTWTIFNQTPVWKTGSSEESFSWYVDVPATANSCHAGFFHYGSGTSTITEFVLGDGSFYSRLNDSGTSSLKFSNTGVVKTSGVFGPGACFNGSSYLASINNNLSLDNRTFSVSGWFKKRVGSVTQSLYISKGMVQSEDSYFHFGIRNGAPYPRFAFFADDIDGTTLCTEEVWYHIVGTFNASSKKQTIYVNGVLENSKTSIRPLTNTNNSPLEIGRFTTYNSLGDMNKIQFFLDSELTPDQVKSLYLQRKNNLYTLN